MQLNIKANMGKIDRIVRLLLAAVIVILYFAGVLSGWVAVLLGLVALIFVVTSAIAFCPLYVPLGISTIEKKS